MASEGEIRPTIPGRREPPPAADERTTLKAFLEFQRATVRSKVAGLTDEQARVPLLRTSPDLTAAGLVRHLTAVERAWFRTVLAGETLTDLASADDPKGMLVAPGEHLKDLLDAYEHECDLADLAADAFQLDDPARMVGRDETLRWIYCHMIEETARHLGHLDLLREHIDGTKGE